MPALSTQLLVIGGGSTGLGVAWDACLRGLKVVLVEQGDLGQGTSGRYHGLLHSGGRYVISDPTSASACAIENRVLRHIIPHAIEDTGGLFVATPADPIDFPDRWFAACQELGVTAEEITSTEAIRLEPTLNPRISRAFRVQDASLDSFDLLHTLTAAIKRAGGQVWLRHRVEKLILNANTIVAAEVRSLDTSERITIGVDLVINATGPWSGQTASLAGIQLPILLDKGSMIAMAARPVHTIINRCRPPSDGDVIVPVGTVAVLGTTDVEVQQPTDLTIEPWEIDFLLAQGEILTPQLAHLRPMRAWAGVRPLYQPNTVDLRTTRELPRAHIILDHADRDGLHGMISVFSGKLTTFRLMAEQATDLACKHMGITAVCRTNETPLSPTSRSFYKLPDRLAKLEATTSHDFPQVICECELVTRSALEEALQATSTHDLDDVRRSLRLGMGPCQAGFCAFRAAGIAHEVAPPGGCLTTFLEERWRGMVPLGWDHTLRQMELMRRVYLELLHTHSLPEPTK